MYYMRLLGLLLSLGVATCVFLTHPTVADDNKYVPEYVREKHLTDSEANLFANKQHAMPEVGSLVMCHRPDTSWSFATVIKKCSDEYYDLVSQDTDVTWHVSSSSIKTLASLWNQVFQSHISLDKMRVMLDERINHYKMHGIPDGHGMIVPAQSKIVVIGDLHGYFGSLQSHLIHMYQEGLLDDQFRLKSNCYVVGLGDYAGNGRQGILVMYTLLKLQENNPGHVFLLAGDHEDGAKAEVNGFQAEWHATYGGNKKDFCLSEMVWLKMLMVWKTLPKVLLVGLQMPSTQIYDFLMFCHGSSDLTWRPDSLMSSIIEKHIHQNYATPCGETYHDFPKDRSFITGTFANEEEIAQVRVKRAQAGDKESIWSKSAFAQFIKHFASRIDKKYRYTYCLCALLRGHDHIPGGIVALKSKGLKTWKPLKDNKIYEIEPCSVYTCTSSSYCMSKTGCYDGAFGLIEAGSNGHWYISSHAE